MTDQKRFAYYTDESYQNPSTGRFHVAKIEEKEPGFWRLDPGFSALDDARRHADELNDKLGLEPGDVLDIIASSLGAHLRQKYPEEVAESDEPSPEPEGGVITVAPGALTVDDLAEQHRQRNLGGARVEILHQRDPDSECTIRVWVDGVEVDASSIYIEDLDPGRGYTAADWDENHAEAIGRPDLSATFRSAVDQAFVDGRESKYVEKGD